jgi:hypothetical protein
MTTENTISAPRVVGRPFPKGKSGNPGGVAKGIHGLIEQARRLALSYAPRAIDALAACLDHADARVRVAAAEGLLDRAGLRPFSLEPERVEIAHTVDVDALRASLAARLASFAASSSTVEVEALALPGGQIETENPSVVSANACGAASREAQAESFPGHSQPYPSGDSR